MRSSHAHHRASPQGVASADPKPSFAEETFRTETIQIERKLFVFSLKENARGRFLRITEDVNGRQDTIIVPAPGLSWTGWQSSPWKSQK
jgi:PurA ssDNA and RNA-binding protein